MVSSKVVAVDNLENWTNSICSGGGYKNTLWKNQGSDLTFWPLIVVPFTEVKFARRGKWRRKWQPTPVFLPGEFHGQRSLAGYIVHGIPKSQTWLSDWTTARRGKIKNSIWLCRRVPSFYFIPVSILKSKMCFLKTVFSWSWWFFNPFCLYYLLIGVFKPFAFDVITSKSFCDLFSCLRTLLLLSFSNIAFFCVVF